MKYLCLLIFLLVSCGNEPNLTSSETQNTSNLGSNNAICTKENDPVCAQPPMPPCPENMFCAQVMPQVKTFTNRCLMSASKATFMYEGECKGLSL